MLDIGSIKPLQRQALLAAIESPTHCLVRSRGMFTAVADRATSGPQQVPAFTKRLVNMLERDGLADFDDPATPSRVTLTQEGVRMAEQLRDSAKAGTA